MKSFQHLYAYIFLDDVQWPDGEETMTIRFRAPQHLPRDVACWLANRKIKREYIDPAMRHLSTVE